jgi:hypothetical protein
VRSGTATAKGPGRAEEINWSAQTSASREAQALGQLGVQATGSGLAAARACGARQRRGELVVVVHVGPAGHGVQVGVMTSCDGRSGWLCWPEIARMADNLGSGWALAPAAPHLPSDDAFATPPAAMQASFSRWIGHSDGTVKQQLFASTEDGAVGFATLSVADDGDPSDTAGAGAVGDEAPTPLASEAGAVPGRPTDALGGESWTAEPSALVQQGEAAAPSTSADAGTSAAAAAATPAISATSASSAASASLSSAMSPAATPAASAAPAASATAPPTSAQEAMAPSPLLASAPLAPRPRSTHPGPPVISPPFGIPLLTVGLSRATTVEALAALWRREAQHLRAGGLRLFIAHSRTMNCTFTSHSNNPFGRALWKRKAQPLQAGEAILFTARSQPVHSTFATCS